MIEFVTILLGLMIGPRTIELAADDRVAAIHVILDGDTVSVLEDGPPWRTTIDLGGELKPRRLLAVAFDEHGSQTGKAQQILNYLRPSHAIGITLGAENANGLRGGQVVWRAVFDQQPDRLRVHFDGEPVASDRHGAFVLPPHQLDKPHAIEAVAQFPDGVESRAELAFGGGLGEVLTSALSPLAVRSPRGKPWSSDDLEGWIEHRGQRLGVFTAHSVPRRVVLLRDIAANLEVRGFANRLERLTWRNGWNRTIPKTFFSFVSPVPVEDHPGTFEMRDPSNEITDRKRLQRSLIGQFAIREADVDIQARADQQLWAALAVAGKRAAASRGPRAVFLMVGEGLDPSAPAPDHPSLAVTLDFLARLRVPVFVWSPSEAGLESLGLSDTPRATHGLSGLRRIVEDIEAELESQTLVLVEGDVLPHEVEWSDGAAEGIDWVR